MEKFKYNKLTPEMFEDFWKQIEEDYKTKPKNREWIIYGIGIRKLIDESIRKELQELIDNPSLWSKYIKIKE